MNKRGIEYLQNMLYKANIGDMTIYENGDMTISNVPQKYLDKFGNIKLPKGELLLIDDYEKIRYGKTAQEVYDILTSWCVFDSMNATPQQMKKAIEFLEGYGVKIQDYHLEYVKEIKEKTI